MYGKQKNTRMNKRIGIPNEQNVPIKIHGSEENK